MKDSFARKKKWVIFIIIVSYTLIKNFFKNIKIDKNL